MCDSIPQTTSPLHLLVMNAGVQIASPLHFLVIDVCIRSISLFCITLETGGLLAYFKILKYTY